MAAAQQAKESFRFYTKLNLSELTGLRASTLGQLSAILKEVPGSCIYHHTHRFLQQHQYLSPEPPNDFAYWVTEILGEDELGERLASIDIVQFSDIKSIREKIVSTIDEYLQEKPMAKLKFTSPNEQFHFIKSISFIIPTNYTAYNLKDFAEILKKVTIYSIYFHIFEARLRLERPTNDFAYWFESSLGETELAEEISRLDPYTYTLENLRETVIKIVSAHITE